MKTPILTLFALSCSLAASALHAEVTVSTSEGAVVEIGLGDSGALNRGSKLKRTHQFLEDSTMPAKCIKLFNVGATYLPTPPSVLPAAEESPAQGGFVYTGACNFEVSAPIDAYELRYLVFDVFGDYARTLSSTMINPMAEGSSYQIENLWPLPTEREASLHFQSIAYLAQVKLSDGKVLKADTAAIAAAMRKLVPKFEDKWLNLTPADKQK